MLRKADLRKLPVIKPDKETIAALKRKGEIKDWNGKKHKYTYKYFLQAQRTKHILKVAMFQNEWVRREIQVPQYEIFIETAQARYITRENKEDGSEDRWSEASISWLDKKCWKDWGVFDKRVGSVEKTDETASLALKGKGYAFDQINRYQQNIRDEARKKAEEKECAPWDADMDMVPETTEAFTRWLQKEAVQEYFIFYKYARKVTTGYCDYCEKNVDISGMLPRNGKSAQCPVCKRRVTFIAIGRRKRLYTRTHEAQLIQKWKDGIVIRQFLVNKSYGDILTLRPSYNISEIKRYLQSGQERKIYFWELYKNREMRWCKGQNTGWPGWAHSSGKIYPRTLNLLNRIDIQQADLFHIAAKHVEDLSLSKWILNSSDELIEKLLKVGLFSLFKNHFNGYANFRTDPNATELHKILRIDKMRLKRLRAMDGNQYALMWLQDEKEKNTIWPDEMIRDFSEAGYTLNGGLYCFQERMSPVQIWNYLKRQYKEYGLTWDKTLGTWADYLRMADKLGMQMELESVYKPKDVKKAHDEAVEPLQAKDLKKEAANMDKRFPKVKKVYPGLKKCEYSEGAYCIVAPKSSYDIVIEGKILKHCVHSCDYYWQRMENRETYILFLRKSKSPDTPYYTLEVEPHGNIRQKRTTGDNQNKDFDDAKKFLEKWQRVIQKRLTAEDKKLGEKSNALRVEELKDIRKQQKRVWHGVLQGKLLADVLEADFMPISEEKEELPVAAG